MQVNRLSKTLKKVLDEHGFNVKALDDGTYEISIYTPEGEDWIFCVDGDEDFISFVEGFDPDEEFHMLYTSGIAGLPKPLDLALDQQWKSDVLKEILEDYYNEKRN